MKIIKKIVVSVQIFLQMWIYIEKKYKYMGKMVIFLFPKKLLWCDKEIFGSGKKEKNSQGKKAGKVRKLLERKN